MPTENSMRAEGQHHEPLLHAHAADTKAAEDVAAAARDRGGFPWLTLLGFAFLTINSGLAIYRSWGDAAALSFVGFAYADLILLFYCLRLLEKSDPGSAARGRLRTAVWLLTTALTVAFSYKVAAIMPIPVQVVVWAMAGATVLGGFYAFFLQRKGKNGLLATLGGVASTAVRLIADTAASMHAVGDRRLLHGLQLYTAPEWVALPNGTFVRVLGFGRIELEHFSIPNVSLIEGFQKCLISMSQLDRDHGMYSCFGRGIGRIMLTDGTEVGGAILDENDGMYVLRYLEVPSRPAQ